MNVSLISFLKQKDNLDFMFERNIDLFILQEYKKRHFEYMHNDEATWLQEQISIMCDDFGVYFFTKEKEMKMIEIVINAIVANTIAKAYGFKTYPLPDIDESYWNAFIRKHQKCIKQLSLLALKYGMLPITIMHPSDIPSAINDIDNGIYPFVSPNLKIEDKIRKKIEKHIKNDTKIDWITFSVDDDVINVSINTKHKDFDTDFTTFFIDSCMNQIFMKNDTSKIGNFFILNHYKGMDFDLETAKNASDRSRLLGLYIWDLMIEGHSMDEIRKLLSTDYYDNIFGISSDPKKGYKQRISKIRSSYRTTFVSIEQGELAPYKARYNREFIFEQPKTRFVRRHWEEPFILDISMENE